MNIQTSCGLRLMLCHFFGHRKAPHTLRFAREFNLWRMIILILLSVSFWIGQVSKCAAAQKVSAGPWHTLTIAADGKVLAFGANDYGQLGNSSTFLWCSMREYLCLVEKWNS